MRRQREPESLNGPHASNDRSLSLGCTLSPSLEARSISTLFWFIFLLYVRGNCNSQVTLSFLKSISLQETSFLQLKSQARRFVCDNAKTILKPYQQYPTKKTFIAIYCIQLHSLSLTMWLFYNAVAQ